MDAKQSANESSEWSLLLMLAVCGGSSGTKTQFVSFSCVLICSLIAVLSC